MTKAAPDLLAIKGGSQAIPDPFPPYRSLGEEEVAAANRVLRSGVLSAFIGAPGPPAWWRPWVPSVSPPETR